MSYTNLAKSNFIFKNNEQVQTFLAAMSSSRSDVVTKYLCPSVCPSLFFLLVSLKFLLVLKSFNDVSRQFKGCSRFNGSFKDVSRMCQGSDGWGAPKQFMNTLEYVYKWWRGNWLKNLYVFNMTKIWCFFCSIWSWNPKKRNFLLGHQVCCMISGDFM